MQGRTYLLLWALSLPPIALALPPANDESIQADEKLLKDAKLDTDGPALLAFFRQRTLTDADRKQLVALVGRLGSDRFAEREEASRQLIARGTSALPFLREAIQSADAEVARRAQECVEQIEAGPGSALPMAAARLLARRKPDGAVAALLAYVPYADDETVEEEILTALLTLTPDGAPAAPLTAALADSQPARRAAAAGVVGRKGDKAQREAVRKLLADKDAKVRLRAARGLVGAGEREAVPTLVDLLGEGPLPMAWGAEEMLYRLAGDKGPAVSIGGGEAEARRKCRDAWAAWWKENGPKVDLARAEEVERLLGLTLGIEFNTGHVWECGPDGRVRWEFTKLAGPMEAQVLPGGRVLIAESNNHLVSERDLKGNILWQKKLDGDQPTGCQRLANGNTFVSTYSSAMEFAPDGTRVYHLKIPGSNAIRKHRIGHVVYATDDEIVEVDTAGARIRSVPLPKESMWVGIEDLPGGRFLLANSSSGRVIEVDPSGKIVWESKVPGACGVARLPNGHTLVATVNRVVELDRTGKEVWERRSDGYVRRVHRR
jgi:hypothetical protein